MYDKHTNNAIPRLSRLLEQLSIQAKKIDQLNAQHKSHWLIENNNLFSQHLFNSQSDQFTPYVMEITKRLKGFTRLYNLSTTNESKAEFALSSLLQIEQQIAALMTAMQANQSMHQSAQVSFDAKKKVKAKKTKAALVQQNSKYKTMAKSVLLSSHQLHQQLNEHHEFERRLMVMVSEREVQRLKSKGLNTEKISQEVLALHQRLGRCRKAISVIERKIELSEKQSLR